MFPGLSDDVETPGGQPPVIVQPARTWIDGPFTVHEFPGIDLPPGTLIAMPVPYAAVTGQQFYANGWQSWSAGTIRRLGHPEGPPSLRGLSRRHLIRLANSGDSRDDVLVTEDGVVGFTSGGGKLQVNLDDGVVYAIRRHVGEPHPPVWTARGDGPALLDQLLDRCEGRDPGRIPIAMSTWEAYGQEINLDIVTSMLQGARYLAGHGSCDIAHIDDGWQRSIGDWTPDPARFSSDLRRLSARIRSYGVAAGLWTAPLLVSPHSELAARHPEWIARRGDGSPVVGANVWHWGGPVWVLDVTRRDVREHLTEVAAAHAAAGFSYFKLDFLYAAADAADAAVHRIQAGQPFAGDLLGADTVTAACLDAIRLGAGPAVTMVGCGAPQWASIGHVDLMRVGPDVTRMLRPHPEPNSDPAMLSSLRNGARSSVFRTAFHRRLWGNDPDALTLSRRTEVDRQRQLRWAHWVARSGQALTLSDNFAELTAQDLMLWERLVTESSRVEMVPPVRALAPFLSAPNPESSKTAGRPNLRPFPGQRERGQGGGAARRRPRAVPGLSPASGIGGIGPAARR